MGRGGSDRRPGDRRPSAGRPPPGRSVSRAPRMAAAVPLRPPALPSRPRETSAIPRLVAARPRAALAARVLGRADPRPDGILRAPWRRGGHWLSGRCARLGGAAVIASRSYDIVVIGSGAGGGTVAQELGPLVRDGVRILVLEKGPRFADQEFTGRELEMADALYQDGGAFLTRDGTMTLAFASAYGRAPSARAWKSSPAQRCYASNRIEPSRSTSARRPPAPKARLPSGRRATTRCELGSSWPPREPSVLLPCCCAPRSPLPAPSATA